MDEYKGALNQKIDKINNMNDKINHLYRKMNYKSLEECEKDLKDLNDELAESINDLKNQTRQKPEKHLIDSKNEHIYCKGCEENCHSPFDCCWLLV